jgi:rhamnosyltransferase
MGSEMSVKIYGVIVTYKPEINLLEKCINSLKNQLDRLIIVDNTPGMCNTLERFEGLLNINIIYLGDNLGIAYAQNLGIKKALKYNADYILLSDQDTVYPSEYIRKMLECFKEEKVAAAGPIFIDTYTNETKYFIKKGLVSFKKIYPKHGKHEVLQLIASGTIINKKYIPMIGLMVDELFIDWVDMEWCWRAVNKGYKIIGNADLHIKHKHGEGSIKLLSKDITLKNSIRYYYTIRNAIFLALYSDNLDIYHRVLLFLKAFRNSFLFPMLSKERIKNLKYTLKGFNHGIIRKLGKLNEES